MSKEKLTIWEKEQLEREYLKKLNAPIDMEFQKKHNVVKVDKDGKVIYEVPKNE